jgi:hypothetical protein
VGCCTATRRRLAPPPRSYTPNIPTQVYVDQALRHVDIDAGIIKSILHPDREVTVQLPVPLDSGACLGVGVGIHAVPPECVYCDAMRCDVV